VESSGQPASVDRLPADTALPADLMAYSTAACANSAEVLI
jgi:hypothetical protein